MDWNDIRYVIAVAEKGSLHQAAKSLGVNHSTAWRRIQALEKSLGCQLFVADRQGYFLTEEGERALQHARTISAHMDAIALETGGKNLQMNGLIRITAPGNFAWKILPKLIYQFRQIHPLVEFEIIETAEQLAIEKREADLAIRATFDSPDNLIGRKLFDVPWGVFCHQDIHNKSMTLEELQDENMIAYRHFDNVVSRWFNQHFKQSKKVVYCNSVNTAQGAAAAKLGFALLPISTQDKLIEVFRLPEPLTSGIWLLAHPEMRNAARIKAFWDFVVEQNKKESFVDFESLKDSFN